jgi:hypothetical protein
MQSIQFYTFAQSMYVSRDLFHKIINPYVHVMSIIIEIINLIK